MNLQDLKAYSIAMKIGELTWIWVKTWDHLAKNSIGKQWVDSADSIAANISEAEGRYNFPDRKRFYVIARGSLYESETWSKKSLNRNLISNTQYEEYIDLIEQCRKMINSYIYNLKQKINK